MSYNADYAGQQAAAGGQQAYDPSAVDPETAKAYEQAWAQYYAAIGTDPNAAAAATAGQDVSAILGDRDFRKWPSRAALRFAPPENSASFRDRAKNAPFP